MIVAIVLAAGKSQRMGAQKLLLPLKGVPVITRVVDEVLASPVDEVLVVVGQDRAAIEHALQGRPVQLAVNPEVGGEMLSSVRRGLRALSSQARAALVVLGDQPAISRAVVAELVLASDRRGGGIAVPTFQGKRGHPLLLSTAYSDEILRSYDAVGLRGLLKTYARDVIEVPVSVPGILEDLDLPADYLRMCRARRTDW
ncbi:MAG: nucleotidyltransferase family protein [Thermoguttaceae bacterium]|jgi:molybdenum cofactor cytidylyltransferase